MLSTVESAKKEELLQLGRCPECGSSELVTDRASGEVVCRKCGLVLRDVLLDQEPEWRAFTLEERAAKVRIGSPTSLKHFDKGLSTTFHPYTDTRGKPLLLSERLTMMRLRKWHIRASKYSSVEKNLSQAMDVLTRLSDKLHIPQDVAENAALIYRRALNTGLVRGRTIKGIVTASLYAACRLTRTPRSLKTMVKASNLSEKEISRCYRLIHATLNIKMPIDEPANYVSKIASKVGVDQQTQNLALELLQRAKKKWAVVGKGPAGIAAAALYIASTMNHEKITQKKLAEAAEVTEVTIRNRYKRLSEDLELRV